MYSLLCRHAKLCILPNQQASDENLSTYCISGRAETRQSSMLKEFFRKHLVFRNGLLIFVLLGTCMTMADGVLTPAISGLNNSICFPFIKHFFVLGWLKKSSVSCILSVLSAVSGLTVKVTSLHESMLNLRCCLLHNNNSS